MLVEVLTPERTVFSEDGVDEIIIPTEIGELDILPNHADLLSIVETGIVIPKKNNKSINHIFVSYGTLKISENKVTLLAEIAESKEEIDLARAKDAEKRAQQKLK